MSKSNPKIVLHVVYAMNLGGIENWLMSIYRTIDKQRLQFHFLVNTSEEAFFDKEIEGMGGKIFYGGSLKSPWRYFKTAYELLSNCEYTAIHVHNVEGAGIVLKAAMLKKIEMRIFHCHDNSNISIQQKSLLHKLYLKTNRCFALKYANKLLAVSDKAGKSLFGNKYFQQISLGININKFTPSSIKKVSKADFGLTEKDYLVGHVGRFCLQKNQLFIVDVAKELVKIEKKYKFLFIGIGDLFEEVQKKIEIKQLKEHFVFAGLRNDVPEIMKHVMDAFLFPSVFEGLGLVLVEAQAAGLPVVCSNVIPEEAIINSDIVKKIDLSYSAKEWATLFHEFFRNHKDIDKKSAYEIFCNSSFNLNSTITTLEMIYRNDENHEHIQGISEIISPMMEIMKQ